MTQREFKEALLRGQGRCVKAVQNDPERYFSVAFWACGHEVAFDAQCELREAALRALENIRHPMVREFALKHVHNDTETFLPILIINYQPQDEALLVELVQSIPINWDCTTSWHGIQLDILRMAGNGLKTPAMLLHYIYDNTYCSCCRESALRKMGRRRVLTEDILQECLYDSNENIRAYARKFLERKKNKSMSID